ncbi:MAG TPA: DUF72 domain-containing protein [Candidatus Limnocylindrales bacterium]|nr:DUF72 domain-containing protein [Candidatus Limnocylindrales bacterium]
MQPGPRRAGPRRDLRHILHAAQGLTTDKPRRPGRLYAGTSGFAYPGWAPRFYPASLRGPQLLPHYASRLPAVELNNTFYARPTAQKVAGWVAATPPEFRFVVKAQRGASVRALYTDPFESIPWLTEPLPGFGERLGAVLFRIDTKAQRNDERLGGLLAAWPRTIPLVIEAQHPSWTADETFAAMRAAGAVLCTTDLDDEEQTPDIRRTGPFLYLRLRRTAYDEAALDAWAARLVPFLDDGMDAYVLLRHDEDGTSAVQAEGFTARIDRIRARG